MSKKQSQIKSLLEIKNTEIASLKQSEDNLTKQVEELNAILEKPWQDERDNKHIPTIESSDHLSLTNKRYE